MTTLGLVRCWNERKFPGMKKLILLIVLLQLPIPQKLIAQDSASGKETVRSGAVADSKAEKGERHEFVMTNFHTESGVTLPQARIVYGTYGHLNAAKDNVILLPSHYMADFHGYEWLIGTDHALDPSKLFLVATELFGNGHSSSPSNTPEPYHGPRFPVTTIRDNVEAVHQLLTEELKVTHLRAIVGFSMGAEQAFQWAVSYPDFADRIVATSGTAKNYPHGVVRLEGQIAALTADAAFQNGDYKAPPIKGLEAFATVWTAWLFSQEWWRRELWRESSPPGTTFEEVLHDFRTDFIPGADANDLILQMRTWERHDIGTTPGTTFGGNVELALRSIKVPLLYMPSETDLYFPVGDARYEAGFIPSVTLTPIPSLWGHTAGAASNPADGKFLNEKIGAFLAGSPVGH
jgi:homoserine O-acetyltransferase